MDTHKSGNATTKAIVYVNTDLPGKRVLIEAGFSDNQQNSLVEYIQAEVRVSHQHSNDLKDVYVSGEHISSDKLMGLANLVREATDGITPHEGTLDDLSAGDFIECVCWALEAYHVTVWYFGTDCSQRVYQRVDGTWRDLQQDIDEAVATIFP